MNRPRKHKSGLPENIRPRHGSYHYSWTEITDGKRKSRSAKLSRIEDGQAKMYEAMAKFLGHAVAPPAPDMPTKIAEYCKWYFPKLTPSVQREYERQFTKIAKSFEEFDVEIVRKKHCVEFLDINFEDGTRIKQVYRSHLVAFFRWCADRGYRDTNPALDIRLSKPAERDRYITDAEYLKIHAALLIGLDGKPTKSGEMVQCFMDLTYLTLQRPTEIRLLRWNQIADGVIKFKPTKTFKKTGAKVDCPITPAIAEVLDRARRIGSVKGMYVIHTQDGAPYTRSGILSAWSRACARAGVENATTRDLRPKANQDAKDRGYSLGERQRALAHVSANTTEGYDRQYTTPISTINLQVPKK